MDKGSVLSKLCLVLGVILLAWGAGYPASREMAVAGAVLLSGVLFASRLRT